MKNRATEGHISVRESREVLADFERDEGDGVWRWLPVDRRLIRQICERVRKFPRNVFLRTGDAIHLGCARENGFGEVHTNDRHMLAAAPLFGLKGVDLTG